MNRAIRLTCLTALLLAVAACGDKEPEDKASAAGEILPGSISDAMLPLDSVRSQPPLVPRKPAAKAGEGEEEGDVDAEAEAADAVGAATDAGATPAASPAATATATATPSPAAPATPQ